MPKRETEKGKIREDLQAHERKGLRINDEAAQTDVEADGKIDIDQRNTVW